MGSARYRCVPSQGDVKVSTKPAHGKQGGRGGGGAGELHVDESGGIVTEAQLMAREAEELVAVRKSADALGKPLKGAAEWGRGQVASENEGKCPVCRKVKMIICSVSLVGFQFSA